MAAAAAVVLGAVTVDSDDATAVAAAASKEMVTSVDVSSTIAAVLADSDSELGMGEMAHSSMAFSSMLRALGRRNKPW